MAELGLNIEENEVSSENKNDVTIDKQVSDNEVEQEKNSDTVNSEKNSEIATNEEENIESIESIPFIAEPAKKKRLRNSK